MSAYVISEVEVRDAAGFEAYRTIAAKAIARYGGRKPKNRNRHSHGHGQCDNAPGLSPLPYLHSCCSRWSAIEAARQVHGFAAR